MVSVICKVCARLGHELEVEGDEPEVGGDKSELDVWEAIQGRRSIRSFKTDPVPEDLIRKLILEAGIWAPSGGKAQTWRFVVVTDPSLVPQNQDGSPGDSR
jgi:translation initiation factor 2B subunit (eIF-2B alpha/beta/delta family)